MWNKRILKVTLAALLMAPIGVAGGQAETLLRVSNWLPPTDPLVTEVIAVWGKNVEQATSGRVKVQIIPALGKPEAHFDLVKNGVADVAMGVDGYTADRFKLPYAIKLPFMAEDATSASVAYWRIHQKHFAKHNEFAGVHLVTLWAHGPGVAYTTNQDIKRLEDLNGRKLRVSGGAVQEIAERLGATPHFSPASQAYELLSRGVVDGIFFPPSAVTGFKIEKVLKNALEVPGGLYRDTHYFIMNQAKYDSLSAADKAAVDRVSGEAAARIAGRSWDNADRNAREVMKSRNYNFITPSPELLAAIKQRLAPMEQEWVKRMQASGIDGAVILADYRAEIAKVRSEAKK